MGYPSWALTTLAVLAVAAGATLPASTLESCHAEKSKLASRVAELEGHVAELQDALEAAEPVQLGDHLLPPGSTGFKISCGLAFLCVTCAALAAGLTMGLVSLEPMEMDIIMQTKEKDMKDDKEKLKLKEDQEAAGRVRPLLQNHHRLLVTLLLMNSIANEALPLFLDKVVPSWLAVILSVTLVLIFGEILPSAVFTGADQLRMASYFATIVKFFQCVLGPIAWPIAKLLDKLLGEDHKGRYNFAELRAIVDIHTKMGDPENRHVVFKAHDMQGLGIITTENPHGFTDTSAVIFEGTLSNPAVSKELRENTMYFVEPCMALEGRAHDHSFKLYRTEERKPADLIVFRTREDLESGNFVLQERDELKIMHGVMNLTHMKAEEAMTPLSEAWMLEADERLTKEKLSEILDSGFSRIPVYSVHKHNVRGFILTKKLIVVSPEDEGGKGRVTGSLGIGSLVVVPPDIFMLDLLNKFQADKKHLALVTNKPDKVLEAWKKDTAIPPDVHMAGIITLEDIIEKLLQEDIEDEHDELKKAKTMSRGQVLGGQGQARSSALPGGLRSSQRPQERLQKQASLTEPLLDKST